MNMRAINEGVIDEFRTNEGRLSGPMAGAPILLLTTTGRHTGSPHTTPVGFIDVDGDLAVAAANGGADDDPDWFRNIEGDGRVVVEVPGASITCAATVVADPRRSELLERMTANLPGMADHVSATARRIPVVILSEGD